MSEGIVIKELNVPSQNRVLDELKRSIETELNCINIGEIQSFDPSDQTATILLSIKSILRIDVTGKKTVQDRPLLKKCPCFTLSGGDSHITFPIKSGDSCIVLFNDREIDNWFFSGNGATPSTKRKHDLSDAIALVGIRNDINKISDYFSGTRLKFNDSTKIDMIDGVIDIDSSSVNVNANVTIEGTTEINSDTAINANLTVTGTINGGISGVIAAGGFVSTFTNGILTSQIPIP